MDIRPDAAAQAALGGRVVRMRFMAFLDIVGDPVRATSWPVPLIPQGSGDADFDNHLFEALDPDLVSVTPVQFGAQGAETLTAALSGLIIPDAARYMAIADKANWQGRIVKLWASVTDPETGAQAGEWWHYFTGWMSNLTIDVGGDSQTIAIEAETYLAALSPASNRTYLDQESFDPGDKSAAATVGSSNGTSRNSAASAAGGASGGGKGVWTTGRLM